MHSDVRCLQDLQLEQVGFLFLLLLLTALTIPLLFPGLAFSDTDDHIGSVDNSSSLSEGGGGACCPCCLDIEEVGHGEVGLWSVLKKSEETVKKKSPKWREERPQARSDCFNHSRFHWLFCQPEF